MKKTYVKVNLEIDEDGKKTPISIKFGDSIYQIDRVLDIKKCAAMKVGGVGERYTIRIGRNITHIYFENNRWFVEEKD